MKHMPLLRFTDQALYHEALDDYGALLEDRESFEDLVNVKLERMKERDNLLTTFLENDVEGIVDRYMHKFSDDHWAKTLVKGLSIVVPYHCYGGFEGRVPVLSSGVLDNFKMMMNESRCKGGDLYDRLVRYAFSQNPALNEFNNRLYPADFSRTIGDVISSIQHHLLEQQIIANS